VSNELELERIKKSDDPPRYLRWRYETNLPPIDTNLQKEAPKKLKTTDVKQQEAKELECKKDNDTPPNRHVIIK